MNLQHRCYHLPNAKSGTDAKVLREKLNWTGPFKTLAVGPSPSDFTPSGFPLAAKLLYLDLPSDMPGPDAHCQVSVARCKPAIIPDTTDLPRYLPAGLTQYVLNNTINSPPRPRRRRRRLRVRRPFGGR